MKLLDRIKAQLPYCFPKCWTSWHSHQQEMTAPFPPESTPTLVALGIFCWVPTSVVRDDISFLFICIFQSIFHSPLGHLCLWPQKWFILKKCSTCTVEECITTFVGVKSNICAYIYNISPFSFSNKNKVCNFVVTVSFCMQLYLLLMS